ncbi:MAG: UDP-N-acetylmuramate dehydrogenase [Bacteroidia bacterium]|nr:UDP-N-acetylmuramate dehydrogenase [Bacteroidia bacterium]
MNIRQHISLKPFNTFQIDIRANRVIECKTPDELKEAIRLATESEEKLMVLGGGSNVLFTDDFDGTILLNRISGIEITSENEEYVFVKASSGEVWHELVMWCVRNNYAGIENMSLIPGRVGAGPIQNIGAYGVELKDVLHQVEVIMIDSGETRILSNAACQFGYRDSIFKRDMKGKCIIISVTLKLSKKPVIHASYGSIKHELGKKGITQPTIRDISEAVIHIRQSKLPDPHTLGNAGSFFKNPEVEKAFFEQLKIKHPSIPGFEHHPGTIKVPAGWLIEQCGFKGKQFGNTGAHKDQALVLVNYGNATGKEILRLAQLIIKTVEESFGITLKTEVNII